ncbi:MAG TPA: methyltransferase type 11 [Verrucomicrobiales bacterium]|nr:methyltransferase type 11 [Verrucomicrobiales bacterium]
MNRLRFSTIAHRDHVFCSPLSSAKADQLVDLLDLPKSGRVLDVGCGKADLLLRVMARYGVARVGVDPNGELVRAARASAEARGISGFVELHEARVADVALEPESFDVALCIGSTHAYGKFDQALTALSHLVRPGGQVLIADGYWKREPAAEYLAFLGAGLTDYCKHQGNESAGIAAGLVPLYSCVSNDDEWDHYEGLYCLSMERFVRDHPQDPDAGPFQERIRAWRDAYRRWGRDTLGFGYYLFCKPR